MQEKSPINNKIGFTPEYVAVGSKPNGEHTHHSHDDTVTNTHTRTHTHAHTQSTVEEREVRKNSEQETERRASNVPSAETTNTHRASSPARTWSLW